MKGYELTWIHQNEYSAASLSAETIRCRSFSVLIEGSEYLNSVED